MPDEIRVEHVYRHSPRRVFEAWTDAAQLARWMCPGDGIVVEAAIDSRVGGDYHVLMDVGAAAPVLHEGHYVTIDPPRLLEFTWRSVNTGGRETLVSVSIEAVDEGSRLTLVHRELPTGASDGHRLGWESILGRLEADLER